MALITQKIIDLLNKRIKNEEQSSRIYKAMSVWLDLNGYVGASKVWNDYSVEELDHANWARQYLLDLNIKPITPAQEHPINEFKGLPQIIALSYKHEVDITNECKELAKACLEEQDLLTFGLAQKYLDEQVNELAKTQLLVDKLEAFGDSQIALRLLDNELGE